MKPKEIPGKLMDLLHETLRLRPKITHSSLIRGTTLLLILIISSIIRLLPLRWGFYLNEFDPYFHYYVAKHISNNGFAYFFSWHDYTGWYPYGRDMRYFSNLGLTVTAITLHKILSILGVSPFLTSASNPLDPLASDPLYNLCVIFPIIAAAFTCLAIYLLGRDLGGEAVGLLSALLLALDLSHIGRTSLGWFDDETIGILSAILLILFFGRAVDSGRTLKSSVAYAVLAGVSLGYLCMSWGAARYMVAVIALFSFTLLVIKRYSPRLLLSHTITFAIALSIAAATPRTGVGFLFEATNLPVYGVLFLLCLAELNRLTPALRRKVIYSLVIIALIAGIFSALFIAGFINLPGMKFLFTLIPSLRSISPLFESVAEHKPSSWATFYYDFGFGTIFVPVGIFFAALMATNLSVLIILYCITSIYFASSMVRLIILASPAICLLWALALKRVFSPLILALRERIPSLGRKAKIKPIEKELVAGLLILVFAVFTLTYAFGTTFILGPQSPGPRVLSYADTPATLSGASLSVRPSSLVPDWIETLTWIRESLPPSPSKPGEKGTVVASWWDYGYWITVFANKTTLADNGTINGTQIAQIGRMFMSNETEAVEILRRYNVTHVVVYVTFDTQGRDAPGYGGDNGKWRWMALIGGLNDTLFGNYTLGWDWVDNNRNYQVDSGEVIANERGQSTVLYKLMNYGKEITLYGREVTVNLQHFKKAYFSQKEGSPSPAPGTSIVPLVCVYEVIYE
ncbi:MAG: STT3 domain-containing protein [Candidatus Bathyarchaeia archaeon]